MTRTRSRSHAAYGTGIALGGVTPGRPPVSTRRQAMVLLGAVVLCAAILGTVVGHMLSAAPV